MEQAINSILFTIAIVLSSLSFKIQIALFVCQKEFRKVDRKILMAISAVRILKAIMTYLFAKYLNEIIENLVYFGTYGVMWVVLKIGLLFWISLLTKSLYDQFVKRFKTDQFSFLGMCGVLFLLIVLCLAVLALLPTSSNEENALTYLDGVTTCSVMLVNILCLCRVLYVTKRNSIGVYIAIVLAFICLFLAGLEELLTFLCEINHSRNTCEVLFNCTQVNLFQVVVLTVIFVVLKFKEEI